MSDSASARRLVVDVVIDGEPVSKERPRLPVANRGKVYTVIDDGPESRQRARLVVSDRVKVYTPRTTKDAETVIAWGIRKAYPRIEVNERDAFRVELEFFLTSRRRRDLDNMTKLVFDACNKFVWKDDAQVEELQAKLTRTSGDPKTVIRIYSFPMMAPAKKRNGRRQRANKK